ncbi:MAG: hypothetical protein WC151_01550 [Bacteroidales bacterium]|nr:hypothetical protein [Bacteroidales bacterium]HPE86594.1 hypothetical protein [Bacteroidales bacterium]
MEINRNNYEAWLLDLLEGNLTPGQEAAVMSFLENHPDLNASLEPITEIKLPGSWPTAPSNLHGKLKRPVITPVNQINAHNYEDFFIAWHEGILRQDEKESVQLFLTENPAYGEEFKLYGAIKLSPAMEITFGEKSKLRKTSVIALYSRIGVISSVAAACIILLLVLKPFTKPTVTNDKISMLQTRPFILSTEAPKLEMRPNSSTIFHFETPDNFPGQKPAALAPPTLTQEISPLPNLRAVPLPRKANQQLIPAKNEYLALAEYLRIQEEMEQNEPVEENNNGTLIGKVIHGLSKDLGNGKDKMTFLNFMEFSLTQYHRITNNPVTVEKAITPEGKTSAYTLATENFEISRKKNP